MYRKETHTHACAHIHARAGLCGPRAQVSPGRSTESWRTQRLQAQGRARSPPRPWTAGSHSPHPLNATGNPLVPPSAQPRSRPGILIILPLSPCPDHQPLLMGPTHAFDSFRKQLGPETDSGVWRPGAQAPSDEGGPDQVHLGTRPCARCWGRSTDQASAGRQHTHTHTHTSTYLQDNGEKHRSARGQTVTVGKGLPPSNKASLHHWEQLSSPTISCIQ